MKDFDADWEERESEEARMFKLRGETFYRRKAVRLETLFKPRDAELESGVDTAEELDRQNLMLIEDRDDAHDRYRALREREDNGLGWRNIQELNRWLIEEQTGLPTRAPSALRNGREQSGTPSTARSSSPAAAG